MSDMTNLLGKIARETSNNINAEFERFFRAIGYTVSLEGQREPREFWHEIFDDEGLVCQVKTETPLAEFLADLPHIIEGRSGVGPTDYWYASEDDDKLREMLSRALAYSKEIRVKDVPKIKPPPYQSETQRHYLGDGLYVSRDRWGTITLYAPRGDVEHYVVLEPNVLAAFQSWVSEPSDEPPGAPS